MSTCITFFLKKKIVFWFNNENALVNWIKHSLFYLVADTTTIMINKKKEEDSRSTLYLKDTKI